MPSAASICVRSFWARNRGLIVPALMAASILVIVVPLPAGLLDLLLSANITVSVIILLTTMYVSRPLEFSVFPSLLLGTTLARLVLNVASTRLILTRGGIDGTGAAGRSHPGLRRIRRRRTGRRGTHHLRHPDRHSVSGDHQGGHAHQRSGGPLCPGRDAGQTDGDRRRSAGRPAQRRSGPQSPRRSRRSRPTFTGRWTVPASSSAAMRSPASSSR